MIEDPIDRHLVGNGEGGEDLAAAAFVGGAVHLVGALGESIDRGLVKGVEGGIVAPLRLLVARAVGLWSGGFLRYYRHGHQAKFGTEGGEG